MKIGLLARTHVINDTMPPVKPLPSHAEHLRLCLQLILQSQLHQLDAGFTPQKVADVCDAVKMQNVPVTHEARLAALQVLAAQLLPKLT